jgi:hypothetical protein
MKLRPLRDYVWIRPRPELAEETTTLKLTHGDLSPDQAEIVKRANTVGFLPLHHLAAFSADYKSHPDSLTFGEVTAIGPGRPELAQDRPRIQVGDLVSYKRNRISREMLDPDQQKAHPDERDKKLFMLHEGGLVFRHPEGAGGMPEPLADYILTEVDPEGAQRALGLTLPLTPEEVAWGISTRVHQQPGPHQCPSCKQALSRNAAPGSVVDSKDRCMVERLVASGPGRWVKAIWPPVFGERKQDVWVGNFHGEPPIGKMVMFSSANERARFRLHGRLFTVASWQDYIGAFDGEADG